MLMSRRVFTLPALVMLVLITVVFPGCSKAPPDQPQVDSAMFPVTVTDDTGRSITIGKQPERIVSLAPSNTEILFALGLGPKVVVNTTYCDYPQEAKNIEKIGGFSDPSIERIVALNPDLVLGTAMHEGFAAELEKLGITLALLDANSIDEVIADVRLVGRMTGKVKEAEQVASGMQSKIDSVETALEGIPEAERVSVFYLMWDDPIMTVGPDTLIGDVLTKAGGVNVAADAGQDYPTYSLEVLVTKNPDVIVYTKMGSATGLDSEAIKSKAGWEVISAVKDGRIHQLDDNLMSRPGPRIVDGLVEAAKALYPNKFSAKGQ